MHNPDSAKNTLLNKKKNLLPQYALSTITWLKLN